MIESKLLFTNFLKFYYLLVATIGALILAYFHEIILKNLEPFTERYLLLKPYLQRFGRKRKYFKNLYDELSKMPFVLHDFELDIEGNYVDVISKKIDIESLKIEEKKNVYQEYEIKPFVLILGNAGIGKTTFTRNVILKILSKKTKILNYEEKELKNVIPIYVPLKIINNSIKSPIVHFVLDNNMFYKSNEKKFLEDLRNRKIFLFLDGYDEVSTIAKRNYLKEELELILGSGTNIYNLNYNHDFRDIYSSFYFSKVWLTSRKEFYKSNLPIPLEHLIKYKENIAGVILEGVDDERFKLVNTLFDKYKINSQKLNELLNAELFIYEIDNSQDEDLISLSKVPLFLTVMCYIYIQDVLETNKTRINFISDYYYLINKFILLLIIELDSEKVKDQTPGVKEAYLTRRNNNPNDKLSFIKYFAFKNYDKNLNTFTIKELKKSALEFFKDESKILDNLKNERKTDIVDEIINNGIFSYIGKIDETEQFDFPHRKFKEVLGVQFIIDKNDKGFIVNEIKQGNSFELGFEYFKKIAEKIDFISILLKHLDNKSHSEQICTFLYEYCLENENYSKVISKEFEKILKKSLEDESKIFVNQKLYEKLDFDSAFYEFLLSNLGFNNSKKISYISLLAYSRKQLIYEDTLTNTFNNHIYYYFKYTKNKEIDKRVLELSEEKIKQYILSIIAFNKNSIDENMLSNLFINMELKFILPLMEKCKILNNQFRIFNLIKDKKNSTTNDLAFDFQQLLYKKKLDSDFNYFMKLYGVSDFENKMIQLKDSLSVLTDVNIKLIENEIEKIGIITSLVNNLDVINYKESKPIYNNIEFYK